MFIKGKKKMKENYEKLEMNIIKFGEHEAVYMDINEGKVISFSISGDSGRAFFSRGYEEEAISWNDILKIGCDTIIVNIGSEFNLDEFNI